MNQFMCLNSFLFISYLILSLFFNKKINEYQNVSDRLKYKNKIVSLYSIKHIILLFVTVLSGLILILVSSQMSKTSMDGLDILIFILFAAFSIPYFIFCIKKMRRIEKNRLHTWWCWNKQYNRYFISIFTHDIYINNKEYINKIL